MTKQAALLLGIVIFPFFSSMSHAQEVSLTSTSLIAPISVEDEIVQKVDGVLHVIKDWFALTHEIAKWKWNNEVPIEDKKEEKFLILVVEKAKKIGLQPQVAKEMFQAQLEASRMIQEHDFENWRKQEIDQFGGVLDFKSNIKPKIDDVCDQFLLKLKDVLPLLRKRNLSDVIKWRAEIVMAPESVSDSIKDAALQPFIMLSAQISMK